MQLKNICINANVILACAVTGRWKGTLLHTTHRRLYSVGNIIFGSLDNKAPATGGDGVTRNEDTAEKLGMQKRQTSAGAELSRSGWVATGTWMAACKELMQGSEVDLRAQQTWDWSNEMASWFWGKKWSVKLLHLPTERGRSPVICHVKGVYISDSQRSKREPEHYVMHRPTSWQWGLGATTDKVEVMEEGLRWAGSLFHLLFLLLCPEARDCSTAQNVSSTGGGQWVSVLLYEAADGASLI